jgi:hypothetical protein
VCNTFSSAKTRFQARGEAEGLISLSAGKYLPYDISIRHVVALRNATMAIGRSRRPRGPTYARGANRSQFEDPELAVNARHLAARRAHPAFKFFYVAHSGSGKFQFRVICASHHGGAGRTHVTPANVRLRWPHASRLASCNLSFRTPLSLSLSLHFLFFSSQR